MRVRIQRSARWVAMGAGMRQSVVNRPLRLAVQLCGYPPSADDVNGSRTSLRNSVCGFESRSADLSHAGATGSRDRLKIDKFPVLIRGVGPLVRLEGLEPPTSRIHRAGALPTELKARSAHRLLFETMR